MTIAIGLLCAVVQLMTGLHLALVDHSFDPVHGAWVHTHDHQLASAPQADAPTCVEPTQTGEQLEACALTQLQFAPALPSTLPPPTAQPGAPLPEPATPAPASRAHAGVLGFAPKTSPPA